MKKSSNICQNRIFLDCLNNKHIYLDIAKFIKKILKLLFFELAFNNNLNV
jgi:hypothetical protein